MEKWGNASLRVKPDPYMFSQNHEWEKTFTWPRAAINNKTNLLKKWAIRFFLILGLSLL